MMMMMAKMAVGGFSAEQIDTMHRECINLLHPSAIDLENLGEVRENRPISYVEGVVLGRSWWVGDQGVTAHIFVTLVHHLMNRCW